MCMSNAFQSTKNLPFRGQGFLERRYGRCIPQGSGASHSGCKAACDRTRLSAFDTGGKTIFSAAVVFPSQLEADFYNAMMVDKGQ